ncbi:DUF6794 domain-containing protein [Flavobacterium sp. GCM10023249]|uniref:DUF6794 domain-containing protein n=1 Tax=unclassified Flavobacterium TaxID=196869 RepID=UPI003612D8FD
MKQLLLILFFLLNGLLHSQESPKKYSAKYPPKNIKEAIEYMEFKWTDEEKEKFKNKNENAAALELHMGYGMWIRNSWLRNGNPKLSKYFYKKKVFHIDDMSSIILIFYHRMLNNKKLGLRKTFKPYSEKWRKGKPYRKIYQDSINRIFDSYKINDTITWKYYTTVIGVTPEEIEKYKDCKVKAVILKRRKNAEQFFIKLISCCDGKGIDVGIYGKNFGISNIPINKTGWTSYWEWESK